ncbi:hypothetical protein [Halosegnis rubeus]|uniref:Uncharacterized protein n=1 Tax=Halosegnis rubeus TaxID=2212850 RepID=A0A5N5U8Z1_9EURY|nr:hypothetical protein [Halosegnis rubeus]KAB7512925.1 hypothetical protein DMP03_13305 [Halosegnis rubeus]KAB7515054.1 hypothetical protein DP108_11565 [Halosegnis rubeus]
MFAGTSPAQVFVREATGEWHAAEQFRGCGDTDRWADRSPRSDGSLVRSLAVDPTRRVAAGVEVGGVLVSADGGTSG